MHGKRIFKAKDTSIISLGAESTDGVIVNIPKDSNGDPLFAYWEFKQAEGFEYVNEKFNIVQAGFFIWDYMGEEWNPIDFSKFTSSEDTNRLTPGFSTMFIIDKNDANIKFRLLSGVLPYLNFDDIIVYVDGVEAPYTLENVQQD